MIQSQATGLVENQKAVIECKSQINSKKWVAQYFISENLQTKAQLDVFENSELKRFSGLAGVKQIEPIQIGNSGKFYFDYQNIQQDPKISEYEKRAVKLLSDLISFELEASISPTAKYVKWLIFGQPEFCTYCGDNDMNFFLFYDEKANLTNEYYFIPESRKKFRSCSVKGNAGI
jgi:hypothetical protein